MLQVHMRTHSNINRPNTNLGTTTIKLSLVDTGCENTIMHNLSENHSDAQ